MCRRLCLVWHEEDPCYGALAVEDRERVDMSSCVACAGSLEFFGRRDGYAYHLCSDCSTLQLVPMPSEKELAQAYIDDYSKSGHVCSGAAAPDPAAVSQMNARYHEAIVSVVQGLDGPKSVLEIGSGYGGMCRLGVNAGLEWHGIDLSRDAAEHCRREGLPVEHCGIDQVDGKFSVIVMCFVFEHLSNYDAFLASCRERLLPGGRIVTLHPTGEFPRFAATLLRMGNREKELPKLDYTFTPPWHTCLMSRGGVEALARRTGFSVEAVHPSPIGRYGSAMRRVVQTGLDAVNTGGWLIANTNWPLIPAHIVVMRQS